MLLNNWQQPVDMPNFKDKKSRNQKFKSRKYLGDIITSSAKVDENVKMRGEKGIGIANQILGILKEVSFGIYHFEMGILFRTSLLINGIIFNTEAMFSLTEKHLKTLEDCDNYFMRNFFNTETGTPIESFFIETSTIPIRFILQGRRMIYYWTILRKSEIELVKRVFLAQQEFPSKNGSDWASQVRQELTACSIFHTDTEIAAMSKYKFKKLVNSGISQLASEYLTNLQVKHSKSKYLHQEAEMKEYLKTDKLSLKEKQLLFKLKVRMTPNKTNFKSKYGNDLSCTLCEDENSVEDLPHLLACPFLVGHPKLSSKINSIKTDDIFGNLDS